MTGTGRPATGVPFTFRSRPHARSRASTDSPPAQQTYRRAVMFRRIVVAYNAGNEGRDALALATRLARLHRARIVVGQAMPLAAGPNVAREAATRMTAARASIAQVVAPDVEVEYRPFLTGEFAASVHAIAAREDADLVVAGQSRLGPLARARLGGGAGPLVAGGGGPVVVAPPDQAQRPPFDPRVIGVGFDGSPDAA